MQSTHILKGTKIIGVCESQETTLRNYSIDNGGNGNWGANYDADINKIKNIKAQMEKKLINFTTFTSLTFLSFTFQFPFTLYTSFFKCHK